MNQHSRFSTVFPFPPHHTLRVHALCKAAFQARWQAFGHFPFSIRLELWCTEVTKPTPRHRDWRKTSPQQPLPITTDYQWVWHRYRIISGHQRDVMSGRGKTPLLRIIRLPCQLCRGKNPLRLPTPKIGIKPESQSLRHRPSYTFRLESGRNGLAS